MKHVWFGFVLALSCVSIAFSASQFDELKSLVGEWSGADNSGVPLNAKYELISGGTVVMESLKVGDHSEMATLYYPDGADLMMTHFCLSNNQPRLKSTNTEPGAIMFDFFDATNLKDPSQDHMRKMVFRWQGSNHVIQERTHRIDGQDVKTVFQFTRKCENRVLEKDASCTFRPFAGNIHLAPSARHTTNRYSQLDSDCTRSGVTRRQKESDKDHCTCRKCNCK